MDSGYQTQVVRLVLQTPPEPPQHPLRGTTHSRLVSLSFSFTSESAGLRGLALFRLEAIRSMRSVSALDFVLFLWSLLGFLIVVADSLLLWFCLVLVNETGLHSSLE